MEPPIPSQVCDSVDGIIPQELSHLKLNRSLLLQLESVYQYQNDKSIKGNINIQKSFADDVSDGDILKWFWPNYKILVIILSLKDCGDISRLFRCFQIFLISYTCFHCKQSSFLTDVMIIKFVKTELITFKEKPPRSTINFVPSGSTFHASLRLNRMCTLHFDTVRKILDLQSRMKNNLPVCITFSKICLVLESLVHVYLAYRDSNEVNHVMGSAPNSSFKTRYLKRSRNMSHKYTHDLNDALRKRVGSKEEKTNLLKIIIVELLRLIDKVHWPDCYHNPSEAQTHRLDVQSTLLVTGDLDLIAKFRLCLWPSWSINLEGNRKLRTDHQENYGESIVN